MKRKKRAAKSSDFPSKKRKLGKGRRPAENATSVTFKSRSIVVPSQLELTQQPTGKRKLTFEALLRHLNHFKPSARSDGLTGLRELFQDHPHLLIPNLAKLVENVFSRIIDSNASVRHSLYTFLNDVFSVVSSNHIRTHFPSIVVHISCGLTHISDGVQLDTLKIFSVLMSRYPTLLPPHAQQLLPLIVGLISRHKNTASSKKTRAHVSLAHDPGSKLSKLSSRIDVFDLLSRFLETILECVESSQRQPSVGVSKRTATEVDLCRRRVMVKQDGELLPVESNLCNFSASVPHVMPLRGQGLLPITSFPSHFKTTSSVTGANPDSSPDSSPSLIDVRSESVFSDVSKFVEFAESLVALLLECWVECALMQVCVRKGALPLMDIVIHLLCLVLKLARHVSSSAIAATSVEEGDSRSVVALDVLSVTYTASYLKHFMTNFPLHCPETGTNITQYVKMNLVLCQITMLLSKSDDPSYHTALQNVCSFYETLQKVPDPSSSSHSSLEWSRVISETLPGLLVAVDGHGLEESYLQCVLSGLDSFYSRCHPQSSAKRVLIHCFRNLLKECSTSSFVFSTFLLPWLESLPQLLVDLGHHSPPLSAFIIDSLASTASYIPLTQLKHHLTSILGSNSVLTRLPSATQRRFAELLWLVPTLDPALLSLIREWICSGGCADSTFLVEVVHHSFQRRRGDYTSVVDKISHYMIFMLELLLNGAGKRCAEATDHTSQNHSRYTPFIALLDDGSDVESRMKLVEVICECLRSTHFSEQVLELASPTLQAVLGDVYSLAVDKVLSVLCFVKWLSTGGNISRVVTTSLARLCVSVMMQYQMSSRCSVAMETCSRAVNSLLKSFPKLLVSVLELFAARIKEREGSIDLAVCFLTLLNSTELNSALRKCCSTIHSAAADITMVLTDNERDIRERIRFSILKFPTRT